MREMRCALPMPTVRVRRLHVVQIMQGVQPMLPPLLVWEGTVAIIRAYRM